VIFYHPQELRGTVVRLADGVAGIFQTLATMCEIKKRAKLDPNMRARVSALLVLTPQRDGWAEIQVIFEYVRDRIRYMSDVVDVETVAEPEQTIRIGAGDCDDKSLLLATMLEVAGHPAGFVATGYHEPGAFEHVYVATELPDGTLLPLDSTEHVQPGWEAPNAVAYYFTGVRC
jgi:transglutaminase-like putative cysteine protease